MELLIFYNFVYLIQVSNFIAWIKYKRVVKNKQFQVKFKQNFLI